ncbi:hypothetical protein [Methanoculleus sp.]|uniref:hypothetical protein n=1 Tax=Methanoculleus sp. TaxID=90427 RepID=UPI0025D11145|nr:hypothetical protein [Methanoculleus sp.]MCK9319664.1 hypothetical protein [Methanoculleus sp.]
MKYLTKQDFDTLEARNDYFKGRWDYFDIVINMAKKIEPKSVLEVGTGGCKLIEESKVVDISNSNNGFTYNVDYLIDITKDLHKIEKRFDLIICLQVLEHLEGKENKTFNELYEMTDNLIISVPYLWTSKAEISHYNITDEKIKEWTSNKTPTEQVVVGDSHKRKIIRYKK